MIIKAKYNFEIKEKYIITKGNEYVVYGLTILGNICLYHILLSGDLVNMLKRGQLLNNIDTIQHVEIEPTLISSEHFDIIDGDMHGLSYYKLDIDNESQLKIVPQSFYNFELSLKGAKSEDSNSSSFEILDCLCSSDTSLSSKAKLVYVEWVYYISNYYGM